MLIHPAAIVALLFYMIVGPLTVPQRFQTRFKSLGYGIHQRISSVLSVPRASFEPQDYPVVFKATTVEALPFASVETNVVHQIEVFPSCPAALEDHAQVVVPEVCPTRYNDNPSPAPVRVFVVSPEYQGPFHWRDLFNYQVLDALTAIYISIWFPLVVIPFVSKLLSRREPLDEIERPMDTPPRLLPPKILAPQTVRIWTPNPKFHAPLEPIFSPAPPEPSTFWLAPQQKRQDQPSPPSPPLCPPLDTSLENELQKKSSPLSSPADSGYGSPFLGTAPAASSLVSDKSVTTTPDGVIDENVDTVGFDTELEDDDDGSTTVTSSTANLADLIACPAPVPAEVLAAKLEFVTTTLVEEVKSIPEPSVEKSSIAASSADDSTADLPSRDEPTMYLPPVNGPIVNLGIITRASAREEISIGVRPPSESLSDTTDTSVDPVHVDEKAAIVTDLGTITEEDETLFEDDTPCQDDLEQDVEPWIPDFEIPGITISPPSDVDPEDSAQQQQFNSEDEEEELDGIFSPDSDDEPESESEHEEPGCDDDSELEYADDYPDNPAAEAVLEPHPSPVEVRDDPCRSPITISGKLWSDDEGDDLGPLPFTDEVHLETFDSLEIDSPETFDIAETIERPEATDATEETETQDPPVEEEPSDILTATLEDSIVEESVAERVQEPVEELQPAPEAPAQEVVEPAPAVPVPSPPSPGLQTPPRASRSYLRTQASSDDEGRDEGSSRSGRIPEPQRLQYYHCCKLYRSDGRPESWENWKLEKPKACIPAKTHLQEWQFVRPTDKDGEKPTTRIAIDNLDADWFRMVDGVLSYNYLTEAMRFFSTKHFRCWRGRTINGIEYSSIGYATIDFDSVDEAVKMFDELQGKRLRGHTWHWRLEFVCPSDDTHGGRKVIRTSLVSDSVKRALAAELEASTRRHGRPSQSSDDASADAATIARPPARVRPQLSAGGRSLFTGAMANVVQNRRTDEQPAQSMTRAPTRRPYRS